MEMASMPFHVRHHVIPGQYIREYPAATSESQENILHLHINQYTPQKAVDPQVLNIMIISVAANSLIKELFKPLWDDLHD